MNPRDWELLNELVYFKIFSRPDIERPWATPLQLGGYSNSPMSGQLRKMVGYGFVEKAVRSSGVRGSLMYRATDAGRAALTEHDSLPTAPTESEEGG